MHLKVSSATRRLICPGCNVLKSRHLQSPTPRRYIDKSPCWYLDCLFNSLFWSTTKKSAFMTLSARKTLVSICFEMNHYKRISPVCQRLHPVWFSTYFTGDVKGSPITIERLRCDMHGGLHYSNCVHCQCRQVSGISKLLSLKGRELECEIAKNYNLYWQWMKDGSILL